MTATQGDGDTDASTTPVSIVSGLRSVDRSLAIASLVRTDRARVLDELVAPGDDVGLAMLDLSDRVIPDICSYEGLDRSSVVLDLESWVDTVELGLTLEHVLNDTEDVDVTAHLRDVITVANLRDIYDLIYNRDSEGRAREAEKLAQLIEFATIVVVTGVDDWSAPYGSQTRALVHRLNPRALVLPISQFDALTRSSWWGRPRRARRLGETFGWMLELAGVARHDAARQAIDAVTFRDPRPFHPWRLAHFVGHTLEQSIVGLIVRSRGLITLASRPDRLGSWSIAGGALSLDPTAMTSSDPDSGIGQELVFFGVELDRERIIDELASCLLTSDELLAGPMAWASYADPFPRWNRTHEH